MRKIWVVLFFCAVNSLVFSQDPRDEEIFGESNTEPLNPPLRFHEIGDTTSVGGRLEVETFAQWLEGKKIKDVQYDHRSTFDTYIDARPHEDVRGFVRLRTLVPDPTLEKTKSRSTFKVDIDEAWIKTSLEKRVFLTYGRQHVKWGVGRFWNPSDFLTASIRDPLATYDKRLGSDLFKIHFPREKESSNFYGILHLDDLGTYKEPGMALRAEFLLAQTELSFSGYGRANNPVRLASDVSSGVGPVDFYAELVYSTQNRAKFYKGEGNPVTGSGFETFERRKEWIPQAVGGVTYSYKYSDEDFFTVGLEYFYNGLGYETRELELFSFLQGQVNPLYLGKHYAGLLFVLPNPGLWNETTFYFNVLTNLVDGSGLSRLSCRTYVQKYILVELWASASFGSEGEFRFRVPEEFDVASAPTGKTQTSFFPGSGTSRAIGASLSLNF